MIALGSKVVAGNGGTNDDVDVYSTEEVKTNEVENGKKWPIYRKCIKGTMPSTAGGWVDMIKVSDYIGELFLLTGTIYSSPTIKTTIPKYESSSYNANLQILNGVLRISQNGYGNVPFIILAKYTKTTD